ncbi:urease accessory protein UreD 2 [Betaproteobacteria bacterium]|nr:urease accessory protein UreD 2 [Betaproteobacteria bacterium]
MKGKGAGDDFPPWQARLALSFARSGARSVLARREHSGPLVIQKTLYPEGEAVCHAVVVHPPGGIASGDQLEIALEVEAGAHALLTTPGATKWYRSRDDSECSRQTLVARLAAGAVLEWLPQENIVFDAARGRLETRLELASGARVIGWEIVCLGRTASGERFAHGELVQHTDLYLDGRLVWRERGRLAGADALLCSKVGLGGNTVYGTLWLAGFAPDPGLLERWRGLELGEGVACAVTALPQVTLMRALSASAEALRAHFVRAWQVARPHCLGREAVAPRIWAT